MLRIILIGLCFYIPFASIDAFAGIENFLPSSDDGSLSLLRQLLGDLPCIWLKECSPGSTTTLFIEILGVVTGSLFMVAGGYYAVNVFVGLTHTARTGKFLGDWDSLAVPFWTGASAIMIAPNPFLLGVAPIHAVVMLVALISTAPANLAWQAAIDYTGEGAVVVPYEVSILSEESAEIPFSILKNEVCTWTIYRQLEEAGLKSNANVVTDDQEYNGSRSLSYWGASPVNNFMVVNRTISWGVEEFRDGICGRLSFPIKSKIKSSDALQSLANDIQRYNALAINQLIIDVRKVAYSIVYSDLPGYQYSLSHRTELMRNAVRRYHNTLLEKTTEVYKDQSKEVLEEFKNNAKQGGWIYSASWFWRLSKLQGHITGAMRINRKTFKSTAEADVPENMAVLLTDNYGYVSAIYDRISPTSGMAAEIRQMEKSGELDFTDRLNLALGKAITGIVVSDDENPLMAMKRVGDDLKTAGAALLGIGAAVAWIPALGESAQFVAPMINMIAGLLITAGVVLGQWIPLIPYITFFFAIAGWLLLVASAFISASIWGFMHASPHGLGKAKPGYIFMLDLGLRPLLLVCGLITGYIVYIQMNGVLNETLFKTIALSTFTSVWDAIGDVVIYVVIQVGLASLCFSFIWKIPAAAINIYSGTSNVLVSPGSEQVNDQAKRTSMILAGIPGGSIPEPPRPQSTSLGQGGGREDSLNDRHRDWGPDYYVPPEIDNKELLPQTHTHEKQGSDHSEEYDHPQQEMGLKEDVTPGESGNRVQTESMPDYSQDDEYYAEQQHPEDDEYLSGQQYPEDAGYFSGYESPSEEAYFSGDPFPGEEDNRT